MCVPGYVLQAMYIAGYTVLGITVAFLLIVVSMRDRIRIAVEVVKEASRALSAMPALVLWPALPLVLTLGYCAFWSASQLSH